MELFTSARKLVERAERHISEFESIERAFNESKPYVLFRQEDRRTGKTLFKARMNAEIPIDLGVVGFDIVGGLRSALDHAVYDGVRAITGQRAPENTKFPFGKTKRKAAENAGGKRSPVPPALTEALLRFKPYQRGNRALYGLNEIRNQKIHRTFAPMVLSNRSVAFGNGYIGRLHIDHLQPKWDRRRKELTYMNASVVENLNMQITISTKIVIDQPAVFRGKSAVHVFRVLAEEIREIIQSVEEASLNGREARKQSAKSG